MLGPHPTEISTTVPRPVLDQARDIPGTVNGKTIDRTGESLHHRPRLVQDHQATCFGGGGGAIACGQTGDDDSSGAQDHGALVNPTPPGQAPGNVFASIEANTLNALPGPIVVAVPCELNCC